ncbi:MAG: hypothetical protein JSU94_21570 [Phycisphaerales bacterium]|nr:MAG: hypothetical protein JSU94_21570 [Phycisphaerales bacterium]
MLIDEIGDIKSTRGDLRKFGLTMAAALAVIGGFLLWRQKGYYPYLFCVSILLLLAGLLAPSALKPVQKIWMTLAVMMGWFMTRLILISLFYLVLTPTALLMRLLGKDMLDIRFQGDSRSSYWIAREARQPKKSDYEKQF